MELDRWPLERDPTVLGVVVHGPAIVARSPGIAIAVRCIFARPGGLELDLVLRAVGIEAEAAGRQSFGEHDFDLRQPDDSGRPWRGGSEPDLVIEVDGRRAVVYPFQQSASGGEDEFTNELRVAVGTLPSDGRIKLTAAWPQAGLAEAAVTLTLASLEALEDRVVQLPVEV